MGQFVWHEYSRLVSITASVYAVWAGFFGIFFRKFFWDFVGGTLRDPGGPQPSPKAAVFITLIVKIPMIQIITIFLALFMIVLEVPLPQLKRLAIYRNLVFRIVMLLLQAFFAALFYQGTNAALWSMIAAGCYTQAVMLGEKMEEAKNNRGTSGKA